MENKESILIEDCCKYYNIETSFVKVLDDYGLISLKQTDEMYYVSYSELSVLEKYVHFYYDLDINMEGIEAISHLLHKIEKLQEEVRTLRS